MARSKPRAGAGSSEPEVFFDSEFDADEFVESMMELRDAKGERLERPARQRVELRSEEKWLRQQLSDWDDLDRE